MRPESTLVTLSSGPRLRLVGKEAEGLLFHLRWVLGVMSQSCRTKDEASQVLRSKCGFLSRGDRNMVKSLARWALRCSLTDLVHCFRALTASI